ncbi:ABC transporter permease [Leptospira sp. GIMC2001]|uniref:ABC transporter permease n=1 Tax=Leptospira sp. GIMC2001 TaxID=1513297 RepID=UPI00234B9B0C|nr:ABC transporter permease subunit [Leptospira sp. GIMC2001]WCL48541.1 ABC transporter permease subunit [Leptospira sp. GIMC2001]
MNPNTKKRLSKFVSNKRAFYSLVVLMSAYAISIFAPLIANNKPLIVYYDGSIYFPIVSFYSEADFGGVNRTAPNYKKLKLRDDFVSGSSFMIFPPIPYGVNEDNLESLEDNVSPPNAPNWKHWLGTDDRGRDAFTRIFYGFRIALTFSLLLVFIEMFLAVIIGGVQGYFGGVLDITVQRIIEVLSSIPFLYLILIMGSFFGKGFAVLIVTYGALSWIGLSYYMRGEFLRLRNLQFIDAARALGVSTSTILFRHLLPNAITPLITFLPFTLISSISILSALDFLGYGIPAPNPSWGEMIGQGRERLTAWWLIAFPSFALFATIMLTAFVGEGLRDAFDAKDKVEYE